ncbi:hypothetical protein [Vibrio sp. OPT18]|uniref:hypothetical protein n=1 Tax=Vibrio sp. OPT18 TaxID=2778641 RepID=UPI00187E021B|nr:hypothetical protein [Vibrio sp. OPT18]MBE8574881.1 hypothetical protein [Vibrio sp. OPT18]
MKSEEIYLLLCLIKKHGFDSEFRKKIVEISEEFGVSTNTVSSLFSVLKTSQCIKIRELYALKGRGKNCYELTDKVLLSHDDFGILPKVMATQNPAIMRLLGNELSNLLEKTQSQINDSDGIKKRQPFRASNRLFLTLLLLHSNELGVIEEISSTQIRKMMGNISAERFKSQLNTLKKLGLVKRHIAGMTGKELFGRTKGSYYLDIEHPFLKDSFENVSSLLLDFNDVTYDYNESTEVTCLIHACKDTRDIDGKKAHLGKLKFYPWSDVMGKVMEDFPIQPVIHFFRNPRFHDHLHQWVCQVASELMLHPFNRIGDLQVNQCSDRLIQLLSLSKSVPLTKQQQVIDALPSVQQIKQYLHDFSFLGDVLGMGAKAQDNSLIYWQHVVLTRLILTLGLNMASRYKKLFELSGLGEQRINQCVVIPVAVFEEFCFQYILQFTLEGGNQKNTKLLVDKDEEVTLLIAERPQDVEPKMEIKDIKKIFVPKPEPQQS